MAQNRDATANVVALSSWQWMTRDDLMTQLNVSTRTFYRRVKSGAVLRRKTSDGIRYRETANTTLPTTGTNDGSGSQPDTLQCQIATAMAVAHMAVQQSQTLAELLRKERDERLTERAERLRWQAVALKLLDLDI